VNNGTTTTVSVAGLAVPCAAATTPSFSMSIGSM
jgi:hypothetical protein